MMNLKQFNDSKGNPFSVEVRYKRVPLGIRYIKTSGTYLRVNFDPRTVDVSAQFLEKRRDEVNSDDGREIQAVREAAYGENREGGLIKLGSWKLVVGFENNMGIRVSEVAEAVLSYPSDFEQTFDELISFLANDGNVEVTVTGSASPLPSDIQGQEKEKSRENNVNLAGLRAQAAKEYIIARAMGEHGVSREEIEGRIITTSKPITGEDKDNGQNQRSVSVEVSKR